MCTAPRAPPPSSSPYAPTAKSFTPSLFKSPMFAIDLPKKSELDSVGPFVVEELISTVESTEPSVFINIMCTAPRALPPSSSLPAPTAKSFTPSPSKSPMSTIDDPKLSPPVSVGPFVVAGLISTVLVTCSSHDVLVVVVAEPLS